LGGGASHAQAGPNNAVERTGDNLAFFPFVILSPVTRRSPLPLGIEETDKSISIITGLRET